MTTHQENNTFIKILIVLVIASLSLLAIVYVFNKAQTSGGDRNLSTPNKIEETAKEFNDMGKIVVNNDMEKTERCGLFYRCELKVFTEGNWKSGEKTDIKYTNEEKEIEINIPNYQSCSNEEYIIPPYTAGSNEEDELDTYYITYPYLSNIYPYDMTTDTYTFIKINERENHSIDDYMNDFTLIKDDTDPNSLIKMKYNDEDIISYQSVGMLAYDCFLLLNDNYQYSVCQLTDYQEPREIDTSMLDNIKINSQNKIKDLLITTNDITDLSSLSLTGENFYLDGNILHVQVAYAGGCKEHDFELYWDGTFEETRIPRVNLNLVHDTTDTCEAYIIKDLQFDLSEMFQQYKNNYDDSSKGLSIKIQSIKDSLEIFYEKKLQN